jgi:hypothetical protein
LSPPLVARSQEAWLYSGFLLWFVLALACLHRSYRQPSLGSRLLAALAFTAAIFSHEFAVLILPVALVGDLVSRLRSRTAPTNRQLIVFWSLVTAVTAAVLVISLALRAPTLGGSMSEIRAYLRPHFDLRAVGVSSMLLSRWHPWLLPAAAVGLVTMVGTTSRNLRAALGFVALLLLVSMAFVGFVLGRSGHERDQLMLIPALVVLGVAGVQSVGPWLIRAFSGIQLTAGPSRLLATVLVGVFVLTTVDPDEYINEMGNRSVPTTWVQSVSDFQSQDLVMSYGPTVTSHYLGRTDFWLRSDSFAQYVWAGRPPYRDIHSNAIVIRTPADLDMHVLSPYAGRTMWVIWRATESRDPNSTINQVLASLEPRVLFRQASPDGNVVSKVQL